MSPNPKIESLSLQGPAGALEALLRMPKERVEKAAVLCHPHPLYQGSMHSPVVFRAARAFHRSGIATLRFNFRGVGRSAGIYDGGRGEIDDVRAAIEFLRGRFPDLPLALAGYSFGSLVGFQAAAGDARVGQLIGIGVPVALDSFDFLRDVDKPLWIFQGDRDEFGPLEQIKGLIKLAGRPSRLITIPGGDHFFTNRLDLLEETLAGALAGAD